jgi:beta-lactam-binding protein with PASTA domain
MRKLVVLLGMAMVVATSAVAAAPADQIATTASRITVPKLHCKRLDTAENLVASKGLKPVERGGGTFGVVIKSAWVVSTQTPKAGTKVSRGTKVYLYASRSC